MKLVLMNLFFLKNVYTVFDGEQEVRFVCHEPGRRNDSPTDIELMKAVMNFPDNSARTILNPNANILIRE